jgi:hypothetical protein
VTLRAALAKVASVCVIAAMATYAILSGLTEVVRNVTIFTSREFM